MKIQNCLILLMCFFVLGGCATASSKSNFMKNTPEQIKIGKLPFSNETGVLYDI